MASSSSVDTRRAVDRLMRFLAVEGVTGQEQAIARAVSDELVRIGVPKKAIRHDNAHKQIPLPTQTGNLIVHLPGTRKGDRLLFMTHLDTVPLCAGAKPVRKGKRISAAGPTALGGDNRTGVAVLVTLVETLLRHELDHPPLTLLFTVREESGLWGARCLKTVDLKNPAMGFNVDGRLPQQITIGAVGAERWHAEITGLASHAGAHPEQGISATMVAALALAEVQQQGYFGKVQVDGKEGSSNIGSFGGSDGASAGTATNVVTDYVLLRGESRSHDAKFVSKITAAYREALSGAARGLPNSEGKTAKVRFEARQEYYPFKLKADAPVVKHAMAAATGLGLQPELRTTNGGLDANWLVRHGIPTVTIGAGQHNIHTISEFVDLDMFLDGCRLAVALAESK
ncbi:MAG: M20/M25/M40 family metallo-hydrolase [Gemmataceae bacterium]